MRSYFRFEKDHEVKETPLSTSTGGGRRARKQTFLGLDQQTDVMPD